MYIKINPNKVKFNNALCGESILIKIDSIKTIDANTMEVVITNYLEAGYIADIPLKLSGNISGLSNKIIFTTDSHFFTVAAKLVYDKIINDLGLLESDLQISSDFKYREDKAARPIRLTIPFDTILKTERYRNLVGQMLDFSVPEYQQNDYYSLYLEVIYPDDKAILEADTRVLIEE